MGDDDQISDLNDQQAFARIMQLANRAMLCGSDDMGPRELDAFERIMLICNARLGEWQ